MDHFKSGVICTKNKLWKKKKIIMEVIDFLISKGYEFTEVVYGEPNDFVFTSNYDDIMKKLSMKGSFYGIRIKMKNNNSILEIESNTKGIDNVKYSIFANTVMELEHTIEVALSTKSIIKPSNNTIAKVTEYLSNHRKIKVAITIIAIVLFALILNSIFPIFSYLIWILTISPFFTILLLYSFFRRR